MLRIGVLGCGKHAQHHIQDVQALNSSVTAISDPSAQNVKEALEVCTRTPTVFNRAVDLLNSKTIDAVILAGPAKMQADLLLWAVQKGLPTLVENPLAVDAKSLNTVHQALELALQKGVWVAGCQPRRFDPPYAWTKEQWSKLNGFMGQLIQVDLSVWSSLNEATDQKFLTQRWPHDIDWLRGAFRPTEIFAETVYNKSDQYQVWGRIDKIRFTCTGIRDLRRDQASPEEIRLSFTRGTCTIKTESGIIEIDHKDAYRPNRDIGMWMHTLDPTNTIQSNMGVVRNFLQMVRERRRRTTYQDILVNTTSTVWLANNKSYKIPQ